MPAGRPPGRVLSFMLRCAMRESICRGVASRRRVMSGAAGSCCAMSCRISSRCVILWQCCRLICKSKCSIHLTELRLRCQVMVFVYTMVPESPVTTLTWTEPARFRGLRRWLPRGQLAAYPPGRLAARAARAARANDHFNNLNFNTTLETKKNT